MAEATAIREAVRLDARMVRAALLGATPWFVDARLERADDGWHASLWLDPAMASARAEQQGLADRSLAGAMRDPAVLRTLDAYVARVNDRLPAGERIVARTLLAAGDDGPSAAA